MRTTGIITILFFSIVTNINAQDIRFISKDELFSLLDQPDDKLQIINFWASWCSPCVAELPVFQEVVKEADSSKTDFLFISLDFPSDAEKKVKSFLSNHDYSFNTVVMRDTDYNSWIDRVDPGWNGNIPATLFYNNSRGIRYFIPEEMSKSELTQTIDSLLTN